MRNKWNLNLFGNYTLGYAYNDTDGAFSLPANNYDLRSEWGRAGQDTRHRFFTGVNFRTLWGINVNGIINAASARPYNITTGFDENGDTVTNDRPAGVKRNTGIGPSNFNTNLNFTKTISLKKTERPNTASNGSGNPFLDPQRGGGFPGGGFPGGGQGRPGGPGGPGGRPGGGGGPANGRGRPGGLAPVGPTMAFVVNIQNVLNNQQLAQYSGVLTSPFFGRANSARNPRQIEVGMRFNF